MPSQADLENRVLELESENSQLRQEVERLGAYFIKDTDDTAGKARFTDSQLRQREYSLRSMLDNMPAMIGYWDKNLHNRFCNKAYSSWFCVSPEQLLGTHIRKLLGEKIFNLNLPYIEAALRGQPQKFERTIPTPDGSGVKYSLAEYIPDIIDGEVQGFFVQVSDITAIKQVEMDLRASEARYRTVVQDQTEVISRLRGDGTYIFANEVFLRFFGKSEAELVGSKWNPLVYHDDLARVTKELALLSPANPVVMIENRVYSGDGQIHWMQFSNRGTFDAAGQLIEIQSVGRDISDRKQAETELHEKEFILLESQRIGHIGSWHYELTGKLYWSDETYRIYGVSPDTFTPSVELLMELIHPDDRNAMQEWIADCADGKMPDALVFRIITPAGSLRILKGFGELQLGAGKNAPKKLVGIVQDITERKQIEEQVHQLAFYDMLTNLPNRRLLIDRLNQAMLASKRSDLHGALMFLDLDNFKPLNDKHGHDVGDLLLIEVASRISGCVRETDTVARFGGDEFVVMLSELEAGKTESIIQASIIAENIRITLAQPYFLTVRQDGKAECLVEHHCTSSIGVTLFIGQKASIDDLLKWADIAMYQAKEDGRNLIRLYDVKQPLRCSTL